MEDLLKKLESALSKEERLYIKLLGLMAQELAAIEKFIPDDISKLSVSREALLIEVATAVDARIQLQNELIASTGAEPGENSTLTEIVSLISEPRLRQRWVGRVQDFKRQAEQVQVKAKELHRVVGWSMSVVGGSLSIIRSAAEEKVAGYNRNGSESASYHPKYSRTSLNLKEV